MEIAFAGYLHPRFPNPLIEGRTGDFEHVGHLILGIDRLTVGLLLGEQSQGFAFGSFGVCHAGVYYNSRGKIKTPHPKGKRWGNKRWAFAERSIAPSACSCSRRPRAKRRYSRRHRHRSCLHLEAPDCRRQRRRWSDTRTV